MNTLLLADLHLTSVARDAYRWNLFPWLLEALPRNGVKELIILGDLTESKDYHSAQLVNRIVDELCTLYRKAGLYRIYILRGNHDGTNPACPYFRFLGQFEFIKYIATQWMETLNNRQVLFLPHSRDPAAEWDTKWLYDAEVIFMHQTIAGAVSENGTTLEGISAKLLAPAKRATIWSGDIHVPQKIGPVEYVGAPYPVRFGDSFKPRAVVLDERFQWKSVLETPRFGRHTLTLNPQDIQELQVLDLGEILAGDQIKVRVRLTRAQFGDWEKLKREVIAWSKEKKVELCGLEVERVEEQPKIRRRGAATAVLPKQQLSAWCANQKIDGKLAEAGQGFLSEVSK